ncbi:hypothetical protein ElyMa_006259300 [Elysia marginata]|uniref:Uncharacterized protein n=1 Tax=Elysia marginata TaxID=1093978 RepID=A0AAV4HBL9_9GAST|nr:hypothetical protein ElyMa_006259300 [Elysia marginata]
MLGNLSSTSDRKRTHGPNLYIKPVSQDEYPIMANVGPAPDWRLLIEFRLYISPAGHQLETHQVKTKMDHRKTDGGLPHEISVISNRLLAAGSLASTSIYHQHRESVQFTGQSYRGRVRSNFQ